MGTSGNCFKCWCDKCFFIDAVKETVSGLEPEKCAVNMWFNTLLGHWFWFHYFCHGLSSIAYINVKIAFIFL